MNTIGRKVSFFHNLFPQLTHIRHIQLSAQTQSALIINDKISRLALLYFKKNLLQLCEAEKMVRIIKRL